MNVEDLADSMAQALAEEQTATAALGHAVGVDHELQDRAGQAEALFDAGATHTLAGIGSLSMAGDSLRQFLAGAEAMARSAEELPASETELVRKLIAQLIHKAKAAISQADTMAALLGAEHSAVQNAQNAAGRHLARQPDAGRLQQTSRSAAEHTREGLDRL